MKKFLQMLFWVLLFTPPLTSCSDKDDPVSDPVRLSTPALSKSDVTQTAFTVRWTAVEHATGYVYTLDDGKEQSTDRTEVRIENLTASTQYSVRVKAISSDPLYVDSDWAAIQITTTSGEHVLTAPANLTASNVEGNSFDLSWAAVDNAAGYAYIVGDAAEQTTTATKVTVTGLTPDTDYAVRVKATGEGDWEDSPWAEITVHTKGGTVEAPFTVTPKDVEAFSFSVTVTPKDATMPYYISWLSDDEWEELLKTDGTLDEDALHESDVALMEFLAMFVGSSYPEVLGEMTYTGTQDIPFESGVEQKTNYHVYVYGWGLDGSFLTETVVAELTTPAAPASSATVAITYGEITHNSMEIICTPDANVDKYYQLFNPASVIDQYFSEGGTEEEFISIVKSQGYEIEGVDEYEWIDLLPETEYQMSIVGLDKEGGLFYVYSRNSTTELTKPDPVDSPLFDELPGEWTGTQTISDADGTGVTTFDATVSLTELSMNYRDYNQIAIKLNGYAGLDYYGAEELLPDGWSEPEAIQDYGPKIILNVEADGSVWVDGSRSQTSFFNWTEDGKIYMFGCDGNQIKPENDFEVTISEDYNTMTISYPVENYYPSILYQGSNGWAIFALGASDIVFTRGAAPASVRKTNAVKPAVRQQGLRTASAKHAAVGNRVVRPTAKAQRAGQPLPARYERIVRNR